MTPRELWPRAIQIWPIGAQQTYFWKVNFHFANMSHVAVPFNCMQRNGNPNSGHWKWMTTRRAWPWAIQIGPFRVQETYFSIENFHFVNMPHAAVSFTACREMWILHSGPWKWMTPRELWPRANQIGPFGVQETYFCKVNFPFVNMPHAAFPFNCMQRNGNPNSGPWKWMKPRELWPRAIQIGSFGVPKTYF